MPLRPDGAVAWCSLRRAWPSTENRQGCEPEGLWRMPNSSPSPPFFRPNVSQPQLLGGRVKVVDALHASSVNYSISPGFVLFCFLGSTVRVDGGRGPVRRNTWTLQQRPAASSVIGFANPRAVRSITACCWPVVLARISAHTLLQSRRRRSPIRPAIQSPGPQSCSNPVLCLPGLAQSHSELTGQLTH